VNKHNIYDLNAVMNITASRLRAMFDTTSLTLMDISDASGFPQTQLKKIRDGGVENLSLHALWKLAIAFKVNPYWLLVAPHNEKTDFVEDMSKRRVAFLGDIIQMVSDEFKVHRRDILGRAKYDFILPARFALCKILRERDLSYSQIGRVLDRDHTTVIHAVRRAEYTMERDPAYAEKINRIINADLSADKKLEKQHG